tara:strand:+ start:54 stop:341 length:288 start_codon:yes stop_codon:yes gene_type:complete
MSEVKFTEEEMKQVTEIRQSYVRVQNAFGQININKIKFDQQMEDLHKAEEEVKSEFENIQEQERNFVDSINKKYGDGNLDVNTGVFTPKNTEESK